MAFIAQFEEFWKNANLSLEMPDDAKKPMFDAWSKIKWPTTSAVSVAAPAKSEVKGKVSGYNLFMRDLSIELKKDTSISGADRMKIVASRWKDTTPDEKKVWQDKASAQASAQAPAQAPVSSSSRAPKEKPAAKPKSPRKQSAYNLFMKSKMAELKDQGVPSKDRMKQIGPMWKELSDEQKKTWAPVNDVPVDAPVDSDLEQ
jgi:hypothetical protein